MPTPLLTLKRITKKATWNIRAMFGAGKAAQMAQCSSMDCTQIVDMETDEKALYIHVYSCRKRIFNIW